MATKKSLKLSEPIIEKFYGGQDPNHTNEFGRWVNNGEPVSPDFGTDVLRQTGNLHTKAMRVVRDEGCLCMLVDGKVNPLDSKLFSTTMRYILSAASRRPHAHVGEQAYALVAPPGISSPMATVAAGRVATGQATLDTLDQTRFLKKIVTAEMRSGLQSLIQNPQQYMIRTRKEHAHDDDITQCPVNDFYFSRFPAWIRQVFFMQKIIHDFVEQVHANTPEDAKIVFPWDEHIEYTRVFMFNARSIVHYAEPVTIWKMLSSQFEALGRLQTPLNSFFRRYKYGGDDE